MTLTASVGADKLQSDCPLGLTRLPVEDNVPVIIVIVIVVVIIMHAPVLAPRAGGVVSVLGAAAEDKLGEVTSLRLRRSVLGAWNLNILYPNHQKEDD